MNHLLLSEIKRLFARRMTRFFPAALAVLMLGGVVIAYFVIKNGDDPSGVDFLNDIAGGPDAPDIFGPISTLLPVMAFVIGASSIGADIKTGMLEQILTWEPRRLRFLVARTVAGLVGVALIAMILAILLVALLWGLAAAAGTTGGTDTEFWTHVASAVLRTGLAAGLFFAFGLGVTLLVNNSVGAIVGFVIYWFIIESFLISVFLPRVGVYLPITNADAFASGTDVERVNGSVFSDNLDFIVSHSYTTAGLILAGWTALSVVAAAVVFSRRDIA